MRIKILIFSTFLTISSAQAQTVGCFYDFLSQQCDGGFGQNYSISSDFITNQNMYGQVMAQAIETYKDDFEGCQQNYNLYYTAAEAERNRLLTLTKRLRRQIAALRR